MVGIPDSAFVGLFHNQEDLDPRAKFSEEHESWSSGDSAINACVCTHTTYLQGEHYQWDLH